jgi:hypothetical protein
MPTINIVEARGLLTSAIQAVYKETKEVTEFFRSFAKVTESNTRYVAIEVSRGTEKIAVDVERGTEGNRNQFSKSSMKIFDPPFYHELFDATQLDFYDKLFTSSGTVDGNEFRSWLDQIVEKLMENQKKIERAYEFQWSQVLETGIVTLNNGTNIDFKRKAASLVDKGAGNYWATGTVSPYKDMFNGIKFLKTEGNAGGGTFNAILGETAMSDFLENAIVIARADIRNYSLDMIKEPQRNSVGGTLHGQVTAGSYKVNLWTYESTYDTEAATGLNYMNPKNMILLPEVTNFKMMFAAVPQLIGGKEQIGAGVSGKKGAFLIGEYLDPKTVSHVIDIKSAGIAVPVAVDQIYTVQVVA